ncbi:hypothetical protein BAU15_15235 [Enterococcus sp. JM4C]|uniref:DUF1803 domain-containing protein n=1 Tax=Candidatus Enterococcus huntleyi TaxID=1857217 RepID=UPI001379C866|nr:DUF1803 domain-containing protein [Enterococcus sp. JM4C]KAF1296474.1 hypothetical protein BAU15_15235 [Enterococcus sp. JM4C]
MNYYYNGPKAKQYADVVKHPLFGPFIRYMVDYREQRLILRQINTEFSGKNFEKFLDKLIALDLVVRENRQYSLGFPIFNDQIDDEKKAEIAAVVAALTEVVLAESEENRSAILGEIVWPELLSEQEYFYGVVGEANFYTKSIVGNQSIQLVSLALEDQRPVTLPDYFALIHQQTELPTVFVPLNQLLGDVNEEYFINQVEMLLEKLEKGRLRTRRRNIFLESLVETGVVNQKEELQLNWPAWGNSQLNQSSLVDTIKQISKRIPGETPAESSFFSKMIFKELLKVLGASAPHYLIK